MSDDLDDLARAAGNLPVQQPRYSVPQRAVAHRVEPPQPLNVVHVPVPIPTPARQQSPFLAGYFATFGVLAAFLTIAIVTVIIGYMIHVCAEARREAALEAERREWLAADARRQNAELQAERQAQAALERAAIEADRLRAATAKPVPAPIRPRTGSPSPTPPRPSPTFRSPIDAIEVRVVREDAKHVHLTGQNKSDRTIENVEFLIFADDDRDPLHQMSGTLPPHAVIDEVSELAVVTIRADARLRVVVSGGRFK